MILVACFWVYFCSSVVSGLLLLCVLLRYSHLSTPECNWYIKILQRRSETLVVLTLYSFQEKEPTRWEEKIRNQRRMILRI